MVLDKKMYAAFIDFVLLNKPQLVSRFYHELDNKVQAAKGEQKREAEDKRLADVAESIKAKTDLSEESKQATIAADKIISDAKAQAQTILDEFVDSEKKKINVVELAQLEANKIITDARTQAELISKHPPAIINVADIPGDVKDPDNIHSPDHDGNVQENKEKAGKKGSKSK